MFTFSTRFVLWIDILNSLCNRLFRGFDEDESNGFPPIDDGRNEAGPSGHNNAAQNDEAVDQNQPLAPARTPLPVIAQPRRRSSSAMSGTVNNAVRFAASTASHADRLQSMLNKEKRTRKTRLLSVTMDVREKLNNPMQSHEIPEDLYEIIFEPFKNI